MKLLAIGIFSFWMLMNLASAELLALKNKEGKIIKAQLVTRGEKSALILVGKKTFTVNFDQLETDSVAALMAAEEKPVLSDEIELDVTMKKTSDKKTTTTGIVYSDGSTDNQYNSYRIDTVFGKLNIKNRHNVLRSHGGEIKIVVLARIGSDINVIHTQSFNFDGLAPLGDQEFNVDSVQSAHTPKGAITIPSKLDTGRYYGYIAAVYVDGMQIAVKSVPPGFQKDPKKAAPFLR